MTDEQIIKALECCIYDTTCQECPYNELPECISVRHKNLLGLINRQKAEIEKLNAELQAMRGAANSYKLELERKEDELHRAKVEISKHFDYMDSAANEAI